MWRLLHYCLLKALLSLLSGGLIASSGLRHLFLLGYLFSFGGKTFMSCTKKMYWSLSCCFWYLAQCTDLRGVFHPFQGPCDVCKIAIWLAEAVHTTKLIQMKARSELGVDLCGFVISRLNWELHAWTQLFRDCFCCRHFCSVVRWGGTNARYFFFFGFFCLWDVGPRLWSLLVHMTFFAKPWKLTVLSFVISLQNAGKIASALRFEEMFNLFP